jgi:hypothetical protein
MGNVFYVLETSLLITFHTLDRHRDNLLSFPIPMEHHFNLFWSTCKALLHIYETKEIDLQTLCDTQHLDKETFLKLRLSKVSQLIVGFEELLNALPWQTLDTLNLIIAMYQYYEERQSRSHPANPSNLTILKNIVRRRNRLELKLKRVEQFIEHVIHDDKHKLCTTLRHSFDRMASRLTSVRQQRSQSFFPNFPSRAQFPSSLSSYSAREAGDDAIVHGLNQPTKRLSSIFAPDSFNQSPKSTFVTTPTSNNSTPSLNFPSFPMKQPTSTFPMPSDSQNSGPPLDPYFSNESSSHNSRDFTYCHRNFSNPDYRRSNYFPSNSHEKRSGGREPFHSYASAPPHRDLVGSFENQENHYGTFIRYPNVSLASSTNFVHPSTSMPAPEYSPLLGSASQRGK